MSAQDGGQAFPKPYDGVSGMSLRDWFAGQALSGIIAVYSGPDLHLPANDETATRAYRYADAMLEESLKVKR